MTLSFELADYSLHQLNRVADEVACTSMSRQWGIPTEHFRNPQSVMNVSVKWKGKSKGVGCTFIILELMQSRMN